MSSEQKLLKIKEEIDSAKVELSKAEGKKDVLLSQLKSQFGCSSIEEAEKKVKTLEKSIAKLLASIEEGLLEIEEKYDLEIDEN